MKQESEQFKIEATPVIDLKRTSVADWDNEKTEVYLEDENGGGTAFLVTSEGDYIPISAFPFVIGRGNECDLVLNRKGISRKHAEIVFQSGRFVVNDLDSLNGLKVNGYKVARVILEEGDSIKLGEVFLVFRTSKENASPGVIASSNVQNSANVGDVNLIGGRLPGQKRKTTFVVASIVLIASLGSVAYYQFGGALTGNVGKQIVVVANPVTNENQQESQDKATPPPATNVSPEISVPQNVVDEEVADLAAPPPTIANLIEPPVGNKNALPASADFASEKVIAKSNTKVFPPAVKSQQVKQTPVVAKNGVSVKQTSNAIPSNSNALKTKGNNPVVQSQTVAQSNIDARYLSGNVDALLSEMRSASAGSLSNDTGFKFKHEQLNALYAKYTAGKQAMIEGRKSEAFALWNTFLNEEKRLYGSKKSVMAATVSTKLADEYVAQGNESAKAGKKHEAYKLWTKSLSYGDSTPARIALDAANQKSKQLYRQALRLEYVNTEKAKELWRQVMEVVPPGTEYHTKASSKLAWYDKWGA